MKREVNREYRQLLWVFAGVLKGILLSGVIAWLFYRSAWGMVLLPLFITVSMLKERKSEKRKQEEREQQQFVEWLGFLKEALQVGYSLEQAVGEARKGLLTAYKEEEPFLCAVMRMQRKMQLGVSVEEAFSGLAKECHCEAVSDFAEVVFIAKRTGGAVHQVIANTERIIHEKQDTLRHIRSMLRSREYEIRIMKCMPFAMLLYMQLFMPDFLSPLYQNAVGAGIMSAGLVMYGGLCMLINRIGSVSM